MAEQVQERIKESTAAALHWQTSEVRVDEVPELKLGSCTFFTAANNTRPVPTQLNFASLGGELLDGSIEDAALRILKTCGVGATPLWQAEVITRFHPKVSGIVLFEGRNPGAIRKVKAAGKNFGNPEFINGVLNFYVLEPEAFIVSQVKATIGDTLQVEVTQL
jgi:hypothetical protein